MLLLAVSPRHIQTAAAQPAAGLHRSLVVRFFGNAYKNIKITIIVKKKKKATRGKSSSLPSGSHRPICKAAASNRGSCAAVRYAAAGASPVAPRRRRPPSLRAAGSSRGAAAVPSHRSRPAVGPSRPRPALRPARRRLWIGALMTEVNVPALNNASKISVPKAMLQALVSGCCCFFFIIIIIFLRAYVAFVFCLFCLFAGCQGGSEVQKQTQIERLRKIAKLAPPLSS